MTKQQIKPSKLILSCKLFSKQSRFRCQWWSFILSLTVPYISLIRGSREVETAFYNGNFGIFCTISQQKNRAVFNPGIEHGSNPGLEMSQDPGIEFPIQEVGFNFLRNRHHVTSATGVFNVG